MLCWPVSCYMGLMTVLTICITCRSFYVDACLVGYRPRLIVISYFEVDVSNYVIETGE